jgi:2,4-dienoyl-CoA reductase-like NADH-dependent reductase (Old Yellow Enzyme family)
MSKLFEPFRLGELQLKNHVVMAPMTRSRAPGNVPAPFVAYDSKTFYSPGEQGYTDYPAE